ncbi:hypothetical protein KKA14_19390 [bacterium]|nr:hypothetical protein [bacterium]
MKIRKFFVKTRILFLIVLSSCSGVEHAFLTKDSDVSKTQSILVMGINWVEVYNDTKDDTEKTLLSQDLLLDVKLVAKRREKETGPELYRELHYISDFKFHFIDENEKEHFINRFSKNLVQYEKIAIHEFQPGRYKLNNISVVQDKFGEQQISRNTEIEKWKRHFLKYPGEYGNWEFEPGKIVYLGNLTLYFKTKRFIFGLFTPEELVDKITLEKISLEDRFDETVKELQTLKPWFPATEMVNMSRTEEWIFDSGVDSAAKKIDKSDEEIEKEKKRKKDSFF